MIEFTKCGLKSHDKQFPFYEFKLITNFSWTNRKSGAVIYVQKMGLKL